MANLTDARFSRCDLNNTVWTLTKLAPASFGEVKLTGAHFSGVQTLGLRFRDSLLVGVDLRGVDLGGLKHQRTRRARDVTPFCNLMN